MVPGTTFVVYAEEQLFGMLTTLFFGTPGRSGCMYGLHVRTSPEKDVSRRLQSIPQDTHTLRRDSVGTLL